MEHCWNLRIYWSECKVEQDGVGRNGSHHEAARYGATANLGPKGLQEVNACRCHQTRCSELISPLIWIIIIVTLLITPLATTLKLQVRTLQALLPVLEFVVIQLCAILESEESPSHPQFPNRLLPPVWYSILFYPILVYDMV